MWRIPSCVSSRKNPLPTSKLALTFCVWKVHFCFQFVRDGLVRLFSGLTELSSFCDSQMPRLVFHFSQFLTRRSFLCSSTFFCAWRVISLLAAARLHLYLRFIAVCLPCSVCFDLFQLCFIFARCLSYSMFFAFLVEYIRKFLLKAFISSITFSVLLGIPSSLVTPGTSDRIIESSSSVLAMFFILSTFLGETSLFSSLIGFSGFQDKFINTAANRSHLW